MNKRTIITTVLGVVLTVSSINAQQVITTKEAPKMDINGTADDLEDTGVVGISGWSAFNKLSTEMHLLEGANYATTSRLITNMKSSVMMLEKTKPEWMNTEEINEDVADFTKDYMELVSEPLADNEEYRENLEEIVEQFEDLREEAKEVYVEYMKTVKDANEEYKEEIEKDRPMKVNMKDGKEEYNEEIKDLKKIPDAKKKKNQ